MDLASAFVIALLVMLIGLLGTIVPGVPGVPLIWLAVVGYVVFDRFQHLGVIAFLVLSGLAVIGTTVEIWTTQAAVRATGGSGWSAAAGTCLAVIGLIFFTVPIALVLALAGVFGIEWKRQSNPKRAGLGSAAWFTGWVISTALQFVIALAMVLIFVGAQST